MKISKLVVATMVACTFAIAEPDDKLNEELTQTLRRAGFTGRVQESLERRLGRPVHKKLAEVGNNLFFDKVLGLQQTNSCAGCHSPSNAFGDSQSIAIGIDSNGIVGPSRQGPRNQRRAPSVVNSAFFPKLMWNGRFSAPSGDPFDNSLGFSFPAPEGTTMFPPRHPEIKHLLVAQGHIPPTELVEMGGFRGTQGTIGPMFDIFANNVGIPIPPPDSSGFRNDAIRAVVLEKVNAIEGYRKAFGRPITFTMIGQALAEFQISLTFANAPIDQFARGQKNAMTAEQKKGALVFFGKARCVECHKVGGRANEMFSDFENHRVGVPQIAPQFGVGKGNVIFDGPEFKEDFGAEQISGSMSDRYKFRTSPLRNVALQPAFFHDGAFTKLGEAIRFHIRPHRRGEKYDAAAAGVAADLTSRTTTDPQLSDLDPALKADNKLEEEEIKNLVTFVREGLLDEGARPKNLCKMIPREVPSGLGVLRYEGCRGM